MDELSFKQKRFVAEYVIDMNGTQAAIRAGYSRRTAEVQAVRLLRNDRVRAAIEDANQKRQIRTEITQDMVLKELAKIAFASGADFAEVTTRKEIEKVWDEEVQDYIPAEVDRKCVDIKLTDDLPPEKKAAISSIKASKRGIEVATYDKVKALDLIGQHLGMFTQKVSMETRDITLEEFLRKQDDEAPITE